MRFKKIYLEEMPIYKEENGVLLRLTEIIYGIDKEFGATGILEYTDTSIEAFSMEMEEEAGEAEVRYYILSKTNDGWKISEMYTGYVSPYS